MLDMQPQWNSKPRGPALTSPGLFPSDQRRYWLIGALNTTLSAFPSRGTQNWTLGALLTNKPRPHDTKHIRTRLHLKDVLHTDRWVFSLREGNGPFDIEKLSHAHKCDFLLPVPFYMFISLAALSGPGLATSPDGWCPHHSFEEWLPKVGRICAFLLNAN